MNSDTFETLPEATRFDVQRWPFHDTPVGTVEPDITVPPEAVVNLPFVSEAEIFREHNLRPAGTPQNGKTIAALSTHRLQRGQL